MVDHAIKMRLGHSYRLEDIGKRVRSLWPALAKPCSMKPYPTIRRQWNGRPTVRSRNEVRKLNGHRDNHYVIMALCQNGENNRLPLYAQVEKCDHRPALPTAHCLPATRLPVRGQSGPRSTRSAGQPFAQRFKVLVQRGLVEIRRGKGTFVNAPQNHSRTDRASLALSKTCRR